MEEDYELIAESVLQLHPLYRDYNKDQRERVAATIGSAIINLPKLKKMFSGLISKRAIDLLKTTPSSTPEKCIFFSDILVGQHPFLQYFGKEDVIKGVRIAHQAWGRYFIVTIAEKAVIEEYLRNNKALNTGRCANLGIQLIKVNEELLELPFIDQFKPLDEIKFYNGILGGSGSAIDISTYADLS